MTLPGCGGAVGPGYVQWRALGMLIQLGVTHPGRLPGARELLHDDLTALDLACSRFRPDSELAAVAAAARSAAGPVTVGVSPLLAEAVAVSLRAAQLTDGHVDPTVGGALIDLGYDRDFAELKPPGDRPGQLTVPGQRLTVRAIAGWRAIRVDRRAGELTVPPDAVLDLGATVKGWAADRSAGRIAAELGCGVLVSLGGDTSVAGTPPAGGWRIRVQERTALPDEPPEGPAQVVTISDGGLATSSVAARRWRRGGCVLHHILDPRTGFPAAPVWRTVSVAAGNCADANTAATAAIIRGGAAPAWLESLGLPARLVARNGAITTVGAWPSERGRSR